MSTTTATTNGKTYKGIVKWYRAELGFGFIGVAPSLKQEYGMKAEADLFVHVGAIQMPHPKQLMPEDCVEFEVIMAHKGPRAVNVRVTGKAKHEPLENVTD